MLFGLVCRFDEARQERIAKYQGMNLFIKNLADEVDDDKLRGEFTSFGTVSSAKVRAGKALPVHSSPHSPRHRPEH